MIPESSWWISMLVANAAKATLILAGAWCAARILRRRTAAERHAVWAAAFVGLVFLALAAPLVPGVPVRLPAAMEGAWRAADFAVSTAMTHKAESATGDGAPVIAGNPGGPGSRGGIPWRPSGVAVAIWAAGALLVGSRYLAGLWQVRRLSGRAVPLRTAEWSALLAEAGLPDTVRLLATHRPVMPQAVGLRRPAVLVPAGIENWEAGRRRAVLRHELAHVRRADCLTQAAAQAACCLYWFHPLAWKALGELVKERERAADDEVLVAGARPSEYAAHLLAVARALKPPAAPAVAMARRSELEGRLFAILDGGTRRGILNGALASAMLGGVLAITAPLASLRALPPQELRAPAAAEAAPALDGYTAQNDFASLDRLGREWQQSLQFEPAEQAFRRSMEVRERVFGPLSREAAEGMLNLAGVLRDQARYGPATALLAQAVPLLETALGQDAPDLALPLFYQGVHAQNNSDPASAVRFYERAAALAAAGGNHTLLGRIRICQALLAERESRAGDAQELYRRAAENLPPDSRAAAWALQLAARLEKSLGNDGEASALEARARAIPARPLSWQSRSSAAPRPEAYRAADGIRAPQLVYKVEPQYTEEARIAKWTGTVVLRLCIDANGLPESIDVARGIGMGLDEQAIEAVHAWRFRAGMKDGKPVAVLATVEVNFRLQ